jgi:hypothetical protein
MTFNPAGDFSSNTILIGEYTISTIGHPLASSVASILHILVFLLATLHLFIIIMLVFAREGRKQITFAQ